MNGGIQNVLIAEACGWLIPEHCISKRRIRGERERNLRGATPDFGNAPDGWNHAVTNYNLPSFTTDLNAMHEAEKSLTRDQSIGYMMALRSVTNSGCVDDYPMVTSTAAQRAEAFLRTIGKWEDGK